MYHLGSDARSTENTYFTIYRCKIQWRRQFSRQHHPISTTTTTTRHICTTPALPPKFADKTHTFSAIAKRGREMSNNVGKLNLCARDILHIDDSRCDAVCERVWNRLSFVQYLSTPRGVCKSVRARAQFQLKCRFERVICILCSLGEYIRACTRAWSPLRISWKTLHENESNVIRTSINDKR